MWRTSSQLLTFLIAIHRLVIHSIQMKGDRVRLLADFLIAAHGNNAFQAAIDRSQATSEAGRREAGALWARVAERVSEIETTATLAKIGGNQGV